jgi:hypothetical protein
MIAMRIQNATHLMLWVMVIVHSIRKILMVMELVMRVTRRNAEMTFRSRVSSAMGKMMIFAGKVSSAFLRMIQKGLAVSAIAMMIRNAMMETRALLILALMILSVFSRQTRHALTMATLVLQRFAMWKLVVNPIRYLVVVGKEEAGHRSFKFLVAGTVLSMI